MIIAKRHVMHAYLDSNVSQSEDLKNNIMFKNAPQGYFRLPLVIA